MKFIDEVQISVSSGNGGNGACSFRREKFMPRGGPDGGNGGRGGHVYVRTDTGLNTLTKYRGKKNYVAANGQTGQGSDRDGASGDDLYLTVPVGTLIKDQETGETLFDLTESDSVVLLAKGGQGGLGNSYFKSSTNQAPRHFTSGHPGKAYQLHLELKFWCKDSRWKVMFL